MTTLDLLKPQSPWADDPAFDLTGFTAAHDDDLEFFRRHSNRNFRLRDPTPAEKALLGPGWIASGRFRPGICIRIHGWITIAGFDPGAADNYDSEEMAHGVFSWMARKQYEELPADQRIIINRGQAYSNIVQ